VTDLKKYISENLPQMVKDFLPDNKGWINRFHIKSETSGRLYVIAQRESTGEFCCSCMSWIRSRTCKHLNNIMPLIRQAENGLKGNLKLNGAVTNDAPQHVTTTPVKAIKSIQSTQPSRPTAGMAIKVPATGPKIPTTGVAKVKKPFVDLSKYKTYDTSTGFGSPEQWREAFGERMHYYTFTPVERKEKEKGLCDTLYEAKTYEVLRDTYYALIKQHHPDVVGDSEASRTNAQILNDTYFELKAKFGKK
jgi:hypothetical protein